jgi:TetR/AcrR family transcriptional regulator, cholesterol catabolism regulator
MSEIAEGRSRGVVTTAPPSPSLLTGNQRARRQRIVDAGLVLLESRDFDRIQVKEVADEAGVALGTLYHYFSSKDHLFAEVLIKWASTLRTSIARHPLQGTTPAERLTEVMHRSVRAFQHRPQLARLLATLEISTDPFATEMLSRLAQTTTSIYEEVLTGVPPERAAGVVRVVEAVLAAGLRGWSAGRTPIVDVYDHLSEAVDLLIGSRAGAQPKARTRRSST